MDWFEKITGFKELPYVGTQRRLKVKEGYLLSDATSARYAVGTLETPTLAALRERAGPLTPAGKQNRIRCVQGDARKLHADPANRGALFQVASQFNLLEMVGPSITPEHGVTRYAQDRTQGPACAIAAGAGTIYRNYLVEVGGGLGQASDRQIDCLADLGAALGNLSGELWSMQNGYALCSSSGLATIDRLLGAATQSEVERLRGLLRIGLHWDVEVTDCSPAEQLVSQAYCSALPVAYSRVRSGSWRRFAGLILEAAYEATMLAATLNSSRGASNRVLLTRLGGGAFGNELPRINAAIERALRLVDGHGLQVDIVCFGEVPDDLRRLVAKFA